MGTRLLLAGLVVATLAGCGTAAKLPVAAGMGPDPVLPEPAPSTIPTVNVAPKAGWADGATPVPADGYAVEAFARGLDHPRWLYVLPNGDVLVAETNRPPREDPDFSLKRWFAQLFMKRAGAAVQSANRITLLRDADGDGVAETRSVLLDGLFHPFGMALVGDHLYVANADAVVRVPYRAGALTIDAEPEHVADLPGGPINHHWTKSLVASADGTRLYVGVGSNSNIAERGLEHEVDRAAVLEIDLATKSTRVFASGLRNPVGMDWEPESGALWVAVNERDELGSDLVPDYMTRIEDGDFFGWPWSYYGDIVDTRVQPQRPEMVARAKKPDYALGPHTASLGLVFDHGGAYVGQHGSWNRKPKSGYKVIFVPFEDGMPTGPAQDVLTGFLGPDEQAYGRPVGVVVDNDLGVLVADDVGNTIWRVTRVPRKADLEAVRQALTLATFPSLVRARSNNDLEKVAVAHQQLESAIDRANQWLYPKCVRCRVLVTGSRMSAADVITNNHEAGVDEGDIVKKAGEFVIVLRDGWLYSVTIGDERSPTLQVVDRIVAVSGEDAEKIWFDEILAHADGLVLLAYNYGGGHAEILTFKLDSAGRFDRGHRLRVRSEDYYNPGNYGARILTNDLVISFSQTLDNELSWPTWSPSDSDDWRPLVRAEDVFLPLVSARWPTIHVVSKCGLNELARGVLDCSSVGVVGDWRAELYVSASAIHLAQTSFGFEFEPTSTYIFRLPLHEQDSVGVARVEGRLPNQFALKAAGHEMYAATHVRDAVLLTHLPPEAFSDRPVATGGVVAVLAREQGSDPIIRLANDEMWLAQSTNLTVQPFSGAPETKWELPHQVRRIEPVGADAAIVLGGMSASVSMRTGIGWTAPRTTALPGYSVSAGWSHEFNFTREDDVWIVGVGAMKSHGKRQEPSDLVFMELATGHLNWLGAVEMARYTVGSEGCDGGCDDWYGDARVFFIGSRIFALSGNALVEAARHGGSINVTRSVLLKE